MDSKPIFRNLLEIFPQVDSRILKAVAIEHSKDIDAAIEFILHEVLPSFGQPSVLSHTVHDTSEASKMVCPGDPQSTSSDQGTKAVQQESVGCVTPLPDDSSGFTSHSSKQAKNKVVNAETDCPSSLQIVEQYPDLIVNGYQVEDTNRSESEFEEHSRCLAPCTDKASDALETAHVSLSSVSERITDFEECGAEVPKNINTLSAEYEVCHSRFIENDCVIPSTQLGHDDPGEDCVIDTHHTPSSVSGSLMDSEEHGTDSKNTDGEDEEHYSGGSVNNCSELLVSGIEMVSLEEYDLSVLTNRSVYAVNVDLLEDCVTDAKSNKKSLVSSVESVVNMMKEAELLEERAKQVKEEASSAGEDTLNKVEELKQMLQHAKQANDMHAGEVYGEKAILSTEARELQSRLLSLSDERNKSFSIVEEIQRTLEARIAAAEAEIAAAEQEKLHKEESALKALKEQEVIMDAIVQESKRLQQEAEENAKLRDFLMDRGRVVDTLQGELAVILEDVMLLKERVDARLPLRRSLLMTTYSSASSLSSSLSRKGTPSADNLLQSVESCESSRESSHGCSRGQEQEDHNISSSGAKSDASDRHKPNSDDDWEIFEHDDSQS